MAVQIVQTYLPENGDYLNVCVSAWREEANNYGYTTNTGQVVNEEATAGPSNSHKNQP